MTQYEFLGITTDERVAVVAMDRPPVNALDLGLLEELAAAFGALTDATDDVDVVVLTGRGRAFCGGRDLKTAPFEDPEVRGRLVKAALASVHRCRTPVVCAVNGPAVGVGFVLAAMCDIIVASEDASFSMPEIDAGANPSVATLLRGVNQFQSRAIAFLGDRYSARQLQALGMVHDVVAGPELMPTALRIARRLGERNPAAMQAAKWSANEVEALLSNFEQAYAAIESRVSAASMRTDASRQAVADFAQHRGPLYRRGDAD
jgi:enoyl-CoA hydratase/carnithine racemase